MLHFAKYIVLFLLSFNISALKASEVTFEPFENDEQIKELPPNFTGASSLPHPVQLRETLNKTDSSLGKLFILARYFEARYPGEVVDLDFSQDVALIFPDMTEGQVQTATKYIRTAIHLYRLGKEKIDEYKKEKLAPKDPPLVVDEDQYAIIGDREYIPTKDDEVAIISDFKKVISYTSNPREIEAMDAFYQRKLSAKKTKTDFENFRLMLSKLDWSKFTSYGVTEPSPFVGNAGIGTWVEHDGFKARLLSDVARINAQGSLILGLHVAVPGHRFMLASNLSENLQKPQIEITNSKNVRSYEIFYPMPVQVTSEIMISAYRGDFAFPIKINLEKANEPFEITTKISFQSCDTDMDCKLISLEPTLFLEVEHTNASVISSMSNFVHQSLYNLPTSKSKYISLENISYTLNKEDQVSTINFDFKYDAPIRNFALFLENKENTVFSQPSFVVNRNHIYVQVSALEKLENLLLSPLTVSVRLNNYATLKHTFVLKNLNLQNTPVSLKNLLWFGLLVGLLFYITPFGMALGLPAFFINTQKNKAFFVVTKTITLIISLSFFAHMAYQDQTLLYFDASANILYINLALILTCLLLSSAPVSFLKKTKHPVLQGLIYAILIAFMFPLSHSPYMQNLLSNLQSPSRAAWLMSLAGLLLGFFIPDLIALYFNKLKPQENLIKLALLLSKAMLVLACIATILWLYFALTFISFCKIAFLFIITLLVLKYFLHFWEALYQTDLKKSYISGAEKTLFILVTFLIALFGFLTNKFATINLKHPQEVTFEQINQRILSGENLLISFQSPNCLTCKYNDLTVFLPYQIEKLKKQYNISYVVVESMKPNENTIEFLKKYKKFQRPLYVYYNLLVPDGAALPDLIIPSVLTKTFQNFSFYTSSSSAEDDVEKSRNTPLR